MRGAFTVCDNCGATVRVLQDGDRTGYVCENCKTVSGVSVRPAEKIDVQFTISKDGIKMEPSLEVVIRGKAKTGKSTVAVVLQRILLDAGIECELQDPDEAAIKRMIRERHSALFKGGEIGPVLIRTAHLGRAEKLTDKHEYDCPECDGKGFVGVVRAGDCPPDTVECDYCNGQGEVNERLFLAWHRNSRKYAR